MEHDYIFLKTSDPGRSEVTDLNTVTLLIKRIFSGQKDRSSGLVEKECQWRVAYMCIHGKIYKQAHQTRCSLYYTWTGISHTIYHIKKYTNKHI